MEILKHSTCDAAFESLLDLFLQAELVVGYSSDPDEGDIDSAIEEMAAGRLAPEGVEQLFSKLRSHPVGVARLASLLVDFKNGRLKVEE